MWKDKHFYPGHIASEEKNGKYLIKFEDGTARTCSDTDVILCDMLSDGQEVFAERDSGGGVKANVVTSHVRGAEKSYTVQYQDTGSKKK